MDDEEVQIRKVRVQPRSSIPQIAVTAIVMTILLGAIIVAQVYLNPARTPAVQPAAEQSAPQ